jgi:hypothetical protein
MMPKVRSQTTIFDANFEISAIRQRDILHKTYSSLDDEDIIPIPIQIFLWRQSK